MWKRSWILILMILLLSVTMGWTQQQDFSVWYDLAMFKDQPGTTYLELYLSTSQSDLTARKVNENYEVGYTATLKLESLESGEIKVDETWQQHKIIEDSTFVNYDLPVLDQVNLMLEPGLYAMNLSIADKFSDRLAIYPDTLKVIEFEQKKMALSNIEFSSQIEPTDEDGAFVKNGLIIVPNPSRIYGSHLPTLYFYAEVYNLDIDDGEEGTFQSRYDILDFKDPKKVIKTFPVQKNPAYGHSALIASAVKVDDLPMGKYFFHLTVTDPDGKTSVDRRDIFHVFQQSGLAAAAQKSVDIPPLTEENESEHYGQVFYHLSDHQYKLYQELGMEGRRNLLLDFWEDRDPTPGTPINEAYLENKRRFEYANEHFSYSSIPGWRTDRGRVYILYGQYDEIERESLTKEYAPYEIWSYHNLEDSVPVDSEQRTQYTLPEDLVYIQGKAPYFVFAELNNDGKYYLIHSNVVGEIKDNDWRRRISKYEEGYIFHNRDQYQNPTFYTPEDD